MATIFSRLPLKSQFLKRTALFLLQSFLCFFNLSAQPIQSSLKVWYCSSEGIDTARNKLISWKDLSGNHIDAFTNTPEAPEIEENSLNGFSALVFNGQNTGLETQPIATFPDKRGTIFVVLKINGRSQRSSVGAGNIISIYHGKGMCWQFSATTKGFSFYDGLWGEGLEIDNSPTTNWNCIALRRLSDTTMNFFLNGKLQKTFSIHNTQPSINKIKIGYNGMQHFNPDDICEVLNGRIAEIMIYNSSLSDSDLNQTQNYLLDKYQISKTPPPYYLSWWFWFLTIILLTMLIILLLKIKQNNEIIKIMEEIKIQQKLDQERLRISKEMHDELGVGLTRIKMTAELLSLKPEEDHKTQVKYIVETANDLVGSLNQIVWEMKLENTNLNAFICHVRHFVGELFDNYPINYTFNATENIPDITLTSNQIRNLFLVIKESLNNSLKHSLAKNILILIGFENKTLIIDITDDGLGFNFEELDRINGINNMKERMKTINGDFTLNSSLGNGTKTLIRLGFKSLS